MLRSAACEFPRHLAWRGAGKRWSRGHILKIVGALVVIAFLLAVVAWSTSLVEHRLGSGEETAELIYLPPTSFLKAISLGYEQPLANVLWFRTISYFGRHYQSDRIYPWLASMCNVVTDLDPRAEHVYRFCGVILPWEADHVEDGITLLEKGVRQMPDSWQLQYMLGFSYYFFRNDLAAASDTLRKATLATGAPAFVSSLASIVDAAHRGPRSAIDFLTELERRDGNDEMRAVIRQRIRELSLAADIESLEGAVATFQRRVGRPPIDLRELLASGTVSIIPEEPFGGRYEFDPVAGRVVSTSNHKPPRLGSSQLREAFLKARRAAN